VNPSELKVMAIACALLSLTLLVTAVTRWTAGSPEAAAQSSERSGWRGGLTLLAVTLLLLISLLVVAAQAGWSRDRALWVGLGGFLALMTLTRPWWFWENWKARWLRGLIGDEATAVVYLALAAAMVWVGLYTDWHFGRQ
jgi:hypothetical protein